MRIEQRKRFVRVASCAVLALVFASPAAALELRVATWNLEHLADTNAEGCVGRTDADYTALAERIGALAADVIAFQEVENTDAAERVFDPERWNVEVSSRPSTGSGPPCRGRPEARLGHLATGIAVRKGLEYRRNVDFSALAGGNRFLRWGTDLSVLDGGRELRVLSVHLKSGCWSAREDADASREPDCETLREQMEAVKVWMAERREQDDAFVIAGDFNRRLSVPGDWAWALLGDNAPALMLPTEGRISRCDERYPEFIDHLVFDADSDVSMAPTSFEESERTEPHPDHCAVSARFVVAPGFASVPFLVGASTTPPWGFVRVVNRSSVSGTVEISAIDDTGERFGPVSLSLDAGAVRAFTSSDLEEGAPERGLFDGVGVGSGHWRLELDTALDVAARAYARGADGYVSQIDATVAETYGGARHRYEVAFFNPGSNLVQQSVLRLVNPGDAEAEVTISAVDDRGEAAPGGDVRVTLSAGKARDLTAQSLESGGEDFDGRFGDGAGKWRLTVSAGRALQVLSHLWGRGGYLASLSK